MRENYLKKYIFCVFFEYFLCFLLLLLKKELCWSYVVDIKDGLKHFRFRKNFKQEDLANALEVNQQNISVWEAGRACPSYQTLRKLLELGATVEEIFGIEYEKMHFKDVESWNEIKSKVYALEDVIKKWNTT